MRIDGWKCEEGEEREGSLRRSEWKSENDEEDDR